jgi:hypothetical protein
MRTIFQSLVLGAEKKNSQTKHLIQQVYAPVLMHCCLKIDASSLSEDSRHKISQQINEMISGGNPMQSLVLMIDIVCIFEGINSEIARQMSQDVLKWIDQEFPNLRDRFVGVSDDPQLLPLRHLVLTRSITFSEIDNQHLFIFE